MGPPQAIPEGAPSHGQGGVPVNLPKGTMIFSDSLKVPGSKRTFAEEHKKLEKKKDKYQKVIDDPKTTRTAKRTAQRNLDNTTKAVESLFLKQQALNGNNQGNGPTRPPRNLSGLNGPQMASQGPSPMYAMGGQVLIDPAALTQAWNEGASPATEAKQQEDLSTLTSAAQGYAQNAQRNALKAAKLGSQMGGSLLSMASGLGDIGTAGNKLGLFQEGGFKGPDDMFRIVPKGVVEGDFPWPEAGDNTMPSRTTAGANPYEDWRYLAMPSYDKKDNQYYFDFADTEPMPWTPKDVPMTSGWTPNPFNTNTRASSTPSRYDAGASPEDDMYKIMQSSPQYTYADMYPEFGGGTEEVPEIKEKAGTKQAAKQATANKAKAKIPTIDKRYGIYEGQYIPILHDAQLADASTLAGTPRTDAATTALANERYNKAAEEGRTGMGRFLNNLSKGFGEYDNPITGLLFGDTQNPGGLIGGVAEAMPSIYNLVRGAQEPELADYTPNTAGLKAAADTRNMRYNIEPAKQAMQRAFNTSRENLASRSRGEQLSGATSLQGNLSNALATLYAQKANAENQYRAQGNNMLASVGAQNASQAQQASQFNAMNRAAGANMVGAGLTGLSNLYQQRRQDIQQRDMDKYKYDIMRSMFGGLDNTAWGRMMTELGNSLGLTKNRG